MKREDLVAYHRTWFKPNNCVLVVAGDTTLAEISPVLEKAFAGWKPGDVPKIAIPPGQPPAKGVIYLVDKPDAAQSSIIAGQLLHSRNDPDSDPFGVLNAALGGQFTSRINMNLREEKGYTYGASSVALELRGTGAWGVLSEVRTDVSKESIQEILKEIREIRDARPISTDELKFAQNNLTMSLPGQYETAGGIGGKLSDIVIFGLPDDYYTKYPQRVRAATVESLTSLARKRLTPDQLIWLIVGDRKVIEPKIRELNLGPIIYLDPDGNQIK